MKYCLRRVSLSEKEITAIMPSSTLVCSLTTSHITIATLTDSSKNYSSSPSYRKKKHKEHSPLSTKTENESFKERRIHLFLVQPKLPEVSELFVKSIMTNPAYHSQFLQISTFSEVGRQLSSNFCLKDVQKE